MNMKCLLGQASGSKPLPKGETMWATTGKITGTGLFKPFRAHIPPSYALDTRHEASGLNVFPVLLQTCFGLKLP
jgi:hypothetical protein